MLAALGPHLGDFVVDRNYRLQAGAGFRPAIFLQGACEDTHGLSDTLLSVSCGLTLAQGWTRTDTIAQWKSAPAHMPADVPAVFSFLAR